MKLILALVAAAALFGCATPYGKYGIAGGYTDSRIDENTFSISVTANGFTDQQTASMHALYRAAELTAESGFDYFIVVDGANNSTSMAMVIPGNSTSNTTITGNGSTLRARTTTTTAPSTIMPMVFPNSTITIKSFVGTKPEGDARAYDARSVMKYLGPQIGVEKKS